jgi:ABC-type glycerol-3-phosphate transport system substrate-binding protein
MKIKLMKILLLWVVITISIAPFTLTVASEEPTEIIDIDWNNPASIYDRITGQGPVEVIPPDLEDYGVKLAGKKGMLTGYVLPEGWREAIGDVKKLVLTNSGSLVHDPATVINATIFRKMTGVHMEFIEMKDALIWPKTMAAAMAKSTDIDLFYVDRAMVDTSILSTAGWIYPVDELFPPEVHKLYPDGVLMSMSDKDGHFFAAPLTLWGEYLFYRPSWLEKAGVGVPDTWQELVRASKKVDTWAKANKGPGHTGMVASIGDPDSVYRFWTAITYAKDARIEKNGKVVIDPDVWNLMSDLWVKGGTAPESIEYNWPDAPEVFAKGKAGFLFGGSVFMKRFGQSEYAEMILGDWEVIPSPAWRGVGIHGRSLGEPDTWAINNFISPEKKAAAMLWIDFYRSYQAQFNELYVEGNESCMVPVYDHPVITAEVEYHAVRAEAVAQHMGEPFPPQTEEALEMVKEYLHKVVMGQMDQAVALRDLQKDINEMQ